MKRTLSILLTLCTLFVLSSCGETAHEAGHVTLKVEYAQVIENLDSAQYGIAPDKRDALAKDGVVLSLENVSFSGTDTAMTILLSELKKAKKHFEEKDGYVSGIDNVYAGDCGNVSGWMFFVNGDLAEVGAREYAPKDGDVIVFRYVVNYMALFE